MEIIATQKFLLLSPRKIRPIANAVKKLKPKDSLERLPFIGRRGTEPLSKVIKQALANAQAKGLSADTLVFKEIQINEGPRLKRGNPVSRGQWHPIKRRMSHIRVVLTTQLKTQMSNVKTKPKLSTKEPVKNKKGGPQGTK